MQVFEYLHFKLQRIHEYIMHYSPRLILGIFAALFLFSSCRMEESDSMNESQRQELETSYETIENIYQELEEEYNSGAESAPEELHLLYEGLQDMRMQVHNTHIQMMAWHEERDMQREKMIPEEDIGRHMQTHMTDEWYLQMKEMHEQIAGMHESINQQSLARMNRQLAEQFEEMGEITPEIGEPTEIPFNKSGNPSLLNGADLYTQNCATCHGNNGEGVGDVFPPLVDSDWVTGDKSIPVRILLHGLTGEIEVDGQQYQGTMPSFKARLSAAEMTAILNYLRDQSEGDQSEITQEDIIDLSQEYSDRTAPWRAEDFDIN